MAKVPEYMNHDKIVKFLSEKYGLDRKKVHRTIASTFGESGIRAFLAILEEVHIKGIGTFTLTKKGKILKKRKKAFESLMNVDRCLNYRENKKAK